MKSPVLTLFRHFSSTLTPQICVVGSGPAGFYAVQYLAKRLESSQIDIYERLPVPFGLVRFGVAPDHFNLKKCINTFTKTAHLKNVNYYGNIKLGGDITLKELKEAYHVVLLAYGVDDCKKLNVPGVHLKNVHEAKNLVGWYNGVPWNKDLDIDLSGEQVAIFGHGNVAIDLARILLSPIDKLKTTDITAHALEALSHSKIKEVVLIGRRGPLQVSFTTKELRELLNLEGCATIWRHDDLQGIPEIVPQLAKPRKRLTELIVTNFQTRKTPNSTKKLKIVFRRSPKQFIGNQDSGVRSVELVVNELEGDDLLKQKAAPTKTTEIIDTQLGICSIGYKSVQADPEIPFDFDGGVIRNRMGRVDAGVYSAGWLANGASGVLLHTMENAFGVASVILQDFKGGFGGRKPGFGEIGDILKRKNIQVVTWNDWLKIDEYERNEGAKIGKPREKIVDIEKMLKIAA